MTCDYSGCHDNAEEVEIVTSEGKTLHANICSLHYDMIDKQSHNIFRTGGHDANRERRNQTETAES